jgi:hypothetical protein
MSTPTIQQEGLSPSSAGPSRNTPSPTPSSNDEERTQRQNLRAQALLTAIADMESRLQESIEAQKAAQDKLDQLANRPPQQNEQQTRRPLKDPSPYAGDGASFQSWKHAMEYKLARDAIFIGDARDQWEYIWANLTSSTQEKVRAFYNSGGGLEDNAYQPSHFMNYLTITFDDPHKRAQALANLEALQMRPAQTFTQFHTLFEMLVADAGGLQWTDEIKINYLRGRVSKRIRTAAIGFMLENNNYVKVVETYKRIATDLEFMDMEQRYTRQPPTRPQTQPTTDAAGDTAMTDVSAASSSVRAGMGKKKARGGTSQGSRQRAAWVSREQFQSRRETGACLRCGAHGHRRSECTLLPAIRPTMGVYGTETSQEETNQQEENE